MIEHPVDEATKVSASPTDRSFRKRPSFAGYGPPEPDLLQAASVSAVPATALPPRRKMLTSKDAGKNNARRWNLRIDPSADFPLRMNWNA
ncbi:MAG: hypothetical protein PVI59_14045 [Anaerolineae bacterium]|jgi:hypothetical protein